MYVYIYTLYVSWACVFENMCELCKWGGNSDDDVTMRKHAAIFVGARARALAIRRLETRFESATSVRMSTAPNICVCLCVLFHLKSRALLFSLAPTKRHAKSLIVRSNGSRAHRHSNWLANINHTDDASVIYRHHLSPPTRIRTSLCTFPKIQNALLRKSAVINILCGHRKMWLH